jgi:hypothetical protein
VTALRFSRPFGSTYAAIEPSLEPGPFSGCCHKQKKTAKAITARGSTCQKGSIRTLSHNPQKTQ